MAATIANNHDAANAKPLLLMTAFPGEGHTNPLLNVAAHLVRVGYDIVFMAPSIFQQKVEQTGAEYLYIDNPITESVLQAFHDASYLPQGPERLAGQYKAIFLEMQPVRTQNTENALVMLQARDPSRQIMFMEGVFNSSLWAFRHGRPLPKGLNVLPKSIGFGVAPVLVESQDTGPISLGLFPDSTESGRQRNKILYDLVEKGPMKLLADGWRETLKKCGCTNIPNDTMFRSCYTAHDFALQLCSPSLDYTLSDLPPSLEFVGVLPRRPVTSDFQYPSWWPEVEKRHEYNYRHVLFVSQGTLNPVWTDLIIPTLQAFARKPDVLVIATLGARGQHLPQEVTIPPNARVVDYLPYDTILEYSDVFISNAGYGTLTHAVGNGVPVLLAGENEEKLEVTMRAIYAGVGLSLGTQTPTAEQVRKGVEQILQDNSYRKTAMKLKIENDGMNALATIEAKVKDLTH
ncbi:udp-glucuronosyl udp-glucosyltransferase [Colletotrichum truncatum]|uniref:Udp-glucuronosyl udp-glucosyltransferase n=1 Tax=Colletotrichum truncatum TaxID=5467 RepID=A0ACC3ZDA0_COLTU|nr:udp-glucuronosyl udp-glucosyltransferase [Colletotrichum truncatum]KAF6798037.1 udp-glucuronosyl udp-glucosyltransferase [Colletotrichum truncatum]